MTRPEWRAIAIIGACSEVTAAQIRDDSTMHKTMVSCAVSALEKRRWVARAPVAGDARSQTLRLTAADLRAHGDLMDMAAAYQDAVLAQLGADVGGLIVALAAMEARFLIEPPRGLIVTKSTVIVAPETK
jgi:DNA-binding MarR family transcriptional regulator